MQLHLTIPDTAERVPLNTANEINQRIELDTVARIFYCAENPDRITPRLTELDREWDIERTIETNASLLAFAGISLGTIVNRKWLLLSAAVTGFLAQHAIQGWCPPVPVLRRLGFRTASEIERERYCLKALRGDFSSVPADGSPFERAARALEATKRSA